MISSSEWKWTPLKNLYSLTLSTVLMTEQLKTLSPELGRLNIIKSKRFEGWVLGSRETGWVRVIIN